MRQFHHKCILARQYRFHLGQSSKESTHLPFVDMLKWDILGRPSIPVFHIQRSSSLISLRNIHSMTSFRPLPHDFASVAWAASWEEMVKAMASQRLRNLHLRSISHRYYSLSALLTRLRVVVEHSHWHSRWKNQHSIALSTHSEDSSFDSVS